MPSEGDRLNQEGIYALDAAAWSKLAHDGLRVDVALADAAVHWDFRPGWVGERAQGVNDGPAASGCGSSDARWSPSGYVLKTLADYFFGGHPEGHGGVEAAQSSAVVYRLRARQLTTFWNQRRKVAQVVSLGPFRKDVFWGRFG